MGLFDFLTYKSKPVEIATAAQTVCTECDITKTHRVVELLQVPDAQRDDNWRLTFYENVLSASFACGDPQTFTGPDGFRYFALHIPGPDQPFEPFCIRNLKDDFLLTNGIGVVINPADHSADWVFSYGDIVNLHINKEFYTQIDTVQLQKEEQVNESERILVAQPSESYLPGQTRQVLKSFLQSTGVKRPKVMLISRTVQGKVIQQLAFNVFREDFRSADELNDRLQQISWFLPKHYIILSVPRKSGFAKDFADL